MMVDSAHKPSTMPSAMPTVCPTLLAVEMLLSIGRMEDVEKGLLVLVVGSGMEDVVG